MQPTRLFDGSWRWRWRVVRLVIISAAFHEGSEVEQDQHRSVGTRGPADPGDVHRLIGPQDARRLDLVEGEPPDLLHLVDEQAELLARARLDEEDARPPVDGRFGQP